MVRPGNTNWRGRIGTVDLLVLTCLDQLLLILSIIFTFLMSYHNEEVICTEPSHSVSVPWLGQQNRPLSVCLWKKWQCMLAHKVWWMLLTVFHWLLTNHKGFWISSSVNLLSIIILNYILQFFNGDHPISRQIWLWVYVVKSLLASCNVFISVKTVVNVPVKICNKK